MLDDTRELLQDITLSQQSLLQNVDDILSHPITRTHARAWVDSLRVLTFDDGHDDQDEESAQRHEKTLSGQCQPCQARLPLPCGHICDHLAPDGTNFDDREIELQKYANPCVHVQERSCDYCQNIPLFPNEGNVTKFCIRRLKQPTTNDTEDCNHFVAVSYCWSSESIDEDINSPAYQVVGEDGSIREARAAKDTIDRAVAFARENGLRMIWIDQVCLGHFSSVLGQRVADTLLNIGMHRAR